MARLYSTIDDQLKEFVEDQRLFFVATAPASGRVNLSPKGMDAFRVLSPNQVCYLDITGSGNETAAHVLENGRITLMFLSFGRQPMILRIYGKARSIQPCDPEWADLMAHFAPVPGIRQIFLIDTNQIQTSCGYGVPEYEFKRARTTLNQWAKSIEDEGLVEYWSEHNLESIDGHPTGLKVET